MALPQKLYEIQEAGGAGRCFFNSVHDSILSRENEFNPKKQILNNIYTCLGINKATYNAQPDLNAKKLQFNRDIRTYLANKIREEPSAFQVMARDDFLSHYRVTQNKAPLEQIRNLGQQDINNYPGTYELLTNPETYAMQTQEHELFELQDEGAISADAIRTMGKRAFYNLIARVLEKNNYTTYALSPIIFLLKYFLHRCVPEGYDILILEARNIQNAQQLTIHLNDRDLITIPVHKTGYAHYQAIVQVPVLAGQDYYIQQARLEDKIKDKDNKFKKEASDDVEKLIQDIEKKYAGFKRKEIISKVPKDIKQTLTGDSFSMFLIPKDYFKKGQWYKSAQEADGIPIVEPFLVNNIVDKDKTSYELQIQMMDGSNSSIVIDRKNGHFVYYVEVTEDDAKSEKSSTKQSKLKTAPQSLKVKPKTLSEFKTEMKKIIGSDTEFNINSEITSKGENSSTGKTKKEKLSLEEFKKKISGQLGGYKKTRKLKRSLKKKSNKPKKSLRRRK